MVFFLFGLLMNSWKNDRLSQYGGKELIFTDYISPLMDDENWYSIIYMPEIKREKNNFCALGSWRKITSAGNW